MTLSEARELRETGSVNSAYNESGVFRGDLDLNLIRTFLSVYNTGSVTAASEELHVSQPTVSYTLRLLRQQLGDPLFVRGPKGMQPTARARELAEVFKTAVSSIDAALETSRRFDPSTYSGSFKLCLSDLGEMAFLPAVIERFSALAPNAVLKVVPMQISELSTWLVHGEIDAAVASVAVPGAARRVLHKDRYVCVTRKGNLNSPELTIEEFEGLGHVEIERATGHHQVDEMLAELGVHRRIALRVHHFSILPNILAACDLAALIPIRVARMFQLNWDLEFRELPVPVPDFEVAAYWNRRMAGSPGKSWFLDLVTMALQEASADVRE